MESINAYIGKMPVALVALAVMSALLWLSAPVAPDAVHHGMLYTTRAAYVTDPATGVSLSIAFGIAAALMLLLLNKIYTYIRTVTALSATTMAALLVAWPPAASFGTGMVLPLLLTFIAIAVFESYEDEAPQQRYLVAAAAVSTGCLFDYAYAVMLPPLVIGMVNAKAMNVRTLGATVLGLITPPWFVIATGLAHLSDFNVPHVVPLWLTGTPSLPQGALLALMAIALILMVANIVSTMGNRLMLRVYNSVFHLTVVSVIGAVAIDSESAVTFVPLLALAVGHEVAQRFSLSKSPLRFVPAVLLIVGALAMYFWITMPWLHE